MALAAYGKPAYLRELREAVRVTGDGGFTVAPIELDTLAKRRGSDEEWTGEHADLAASVQLRLEEVLLELVGWLHAQTGDRDLTMAGGVALNCVANSVLAEQGPFERIWVQPAAGDAGTALGAAMHVAHALGDRVAPMPAPPSGAAGPTTSWPPGWPRPGSPTSARPTWPTRSPRCSPPTAWSPGSRAAASTGRAPSGTAACSPTRPGRPTWSGSTTSRAASSSGRWPRWSWPSGPATSSRGPCRAPTCCSPTGCGRPGASGSRPWSTSTAAPASRPSTAPRSRWSPRLLEAFERRTGVPVVVNTSLNTAGRPMVDDPRDALECFGSAPVDVLALGPFLVRRAAFTRP